MDILVIAKQVDLLAGTDSEIAAERDRGVVDAWLGPDQRLSGSTPRRRAPEAGLER